MPTLTVTVAGTDRSTYVCDPSSGPAATFSEELGQRPKFDVTFRSLDGSWIPLRGQAITVEHSVLGLIFGGYISTVTRRKASGNPTLFADCTCVSWEQVMSRRLCIAHTWTNTAAEDIFDDIIQGSLVDVGDEGFTTELESGPTLELFDVQEPRPTVAEALDRLCELASNGTDVYYWDSTPDKVARFFRQETYDAPFDISDASTDILDTEGGSIRINETNQGIVNRVFVYLGQFLRDAEPQPFVGDGSTRTFELDYSCGAAPTVTVDGVGQSVGIEGSDTGKQWYWQLGSKRIRQDDGEDELTADNDLIVTYQGLDRRATAPFDGADSASYEGTIQGSGTGVYETMLTIDGPATLADAATLAQAHLDRYSTATVTFEASTLTEGLRCGQEIDVEITPLDIDLTMLIRSVTMTDRGDGDFLWSFTAIFGAARDDWRSVFKKGGRSTSITGAGSGGSTPAATPGALTFTLTLAQFGSIGFENVDIEDPNTYTGIDFYMIYVDELLPDVFVTLDGDLDSSTDPATVNVTDNPDLVTDPSVLDFAEGDWVLFNDAGAYEIGQITAISGSAPNRSFTIQRHYPGALAGTSTFEAPMAAHDSGTQLFKAQVHRFLPNVQPGGFDDGAPPQRFSTPLPAACLLAVTAAPFNKDVYGNWTNVNAATATLPGIRTLAGGEYSFQLAGALTAAAGVNKAQDFSVPFTTPSRVNSCYVDTAPTGASLKVNIRRSKDEGSTWETLEQIVIAIAAKISWSGGDPPENRQAPYSGDWPFPVLDGGDRINFTIEQVGSTVAGSNLTVKIGI